MQAIIIILLVAVTFYMGFSDGSNSIAACVATRALKPTIAVIIAGVSMVVTPIIACFVLKQTSVARTITSLLNSEALNSVSDNEGKLFLISALMGFVVWAIISFISSTPNSTSHTMLGSLVGAGIVTFGFASVDWIAVLLKVVLMVFAAPLLSIAVSYVFFKIFYAIGIRLDRSVRPVFRYAQGINVALIASSISINNVQKSLGFYLLYALYFFGTDTQTGEIGFLPIMLASVVLALGLLFGGNRIVNTVGNKLYKLNTIRAYVTQLSTAAVMFTASLTGIPVSAGQVVSSSVIGVGIAQRMSNVRWLTARRIFVSWIVTFPAAICVGALVNLILRLFL